MNNPTTIDDLFDLFAARQISFEEIMKHAGKSSEEEVNEQLLLHLAATKAIRRYAIHQQVADIHKMYAPEKAAPSVSAAPVKSLHSTSPVKWMMRIAASVTLLIGLYAAQNVMFMSPDKMYESNFQDYYINTERSTPAVTETEISAAFRAQDYKQVIALYDNQKETGNREKFLAGYAHMQLNNYTEAGSLFSSIIEANQQKGDTYFQDEAEYYLAMALLKSGNTEGARNLFQKIHDTREHTFHESVSSWMLFRMKWF